MNNKRARSVFQVVTSAVGTICLVLMAIESMIQTDIAKKSHQELQQVSAWIDLHVAEQQIYKSRAELFARELEKIKQ